MGLRSGMMGRNGKRSFQSFRAETFYLLNQMATKGLQYFVHFPHSIPQSINARILKLWNPAFGGTRGTIYSHLKALK